MSGPQRLAVLLAGEHIADITRTPTTTRLSYRENAGASSTPLSLSLPPARRTFTGDHVTNWLWGLLPESAPAREAIERLYGADSRDPLALLAAVGLECAGAVQLCVPDQLEAVQRPNGDLELASDAVIESRLSDLELSDERSWTMPAEHWSLGGVHSKFTLRLDSGRWHFPHGAEPSTHIVKPGVRGMRAQALVEHVSMAAAGALGLDVATTAYCDFGSQRAIVITRFDRTAHAGGVRRSHTEDLCQAMGVREKYEDHGGPSAADVVSFLRDQSATRADARRNVEQFVDLLVYNTLVGAPDAHARNYSVLLDQDRVLLAPGYDIASGLAYDRSPARPHEVAMSIGGDVALEEIDPPAFARTATALGIDPTVLLGRVRELASAIPGAFDTALTAVDDWDGSVTAVRSRLLPTLTERCATFTG